MTLDLHEAAAEGDLETVRTLLEQGTGVNLRDKRGLTALIHAAMWNRSNLAEMVALLLEHGADIDAATQEGTTALLALIEDEESEPERAAVLLDAGAAIDAANIYGYTALLLAAAQQNVDMVSLLISRGANVNHRDNHGDSVLSYAASGYRQEVLVPLLQEAGAIE